MHKRLIWADIVRILAVYFILVLHMMSVHHPKQTNFIFNMGVTLADTCVPLLVMLSGALLLPKQESYRHFLTKRVNRVVIPWITWTCIFTIIVILFHGTSSLGNILHIFHSMFVPFFWFIVLICSLYALTPALRIFVLTAKTRDIFIVILLWYIAVSILPYIRNTEAFPLNIGNGIVQLAVDFLGYFLLGYLITKIKLQKYTRFIRILFVISFILRSLMHYTSIHYNIHLLAGADYIDPGLVITSASLFALIYLGENIYKKRVKQVVKNILPTISKATLGIYFVHYLFLNRAPLPRLIPTTSLIHLSENIDMFFNAFIFFIISFAIILVLMKIKYIKSLIT